MYVIRNYIYQAQQDWRKNTWCDEFFVPVCRIPLDMQHNILYNEGYYSNKNTNMSVIWWYVTLEHSRTGNLTTPHNQQIDNGLSSLTAGLRQLSGVRSASHYQTDRIRSYRSALRSIFINCELPARCNVHVSSWVKCRGYLLSLFNDIWRGSYQDSKCTLKWVVPAALFGVFLDKIILKGCGFILVGRCRQGNYHSRYTGACIKQYLSLIPVNLIITWSKSGVNQLSTNSFWQEYLTYLWS